MTVSTASDITVIEKDHSKDYKETWILAYNPNNPPEKEVIKILIKEPMVWNLVEKDKTYFATYSNKGGNDWLLQKIKNISDDDSAK